MNNKVSHKQAISVANECLFMINPSWRNKFINPIIEIDLGISKALDMIGRELIMGNDHLFSQEQLEILRCADYQLNRIGYISDDEDNRNCLKCEGC